MKSAARAAVDASRIRALASMDVSAVAPYFHAGVTGIVPQPCPGLRSWAMTKKGVLLYDPVTTVEWAETYGRAAMAGLYLHEALHWICCHGMRRGDRDAGQWNIAADLWVNAVVTDIKGLDVPSCGVAVADYVDADGKPFPRGLTADAYYELLEDASLSPSGQAKAEANEAAGGVESLPAAGKCGSGAGNELDGEAKAEADARAGGEDAYAKSPMAGQSMATQLATAKAVAKDLRVHAAKNAGRMPAGLDRWCDGLLTVEPIPWPVTMGRTLRPWVEKAGRGARTYATPSRLTACLRRPGRRAVVLPSRVMRKIKWWVIIDTSGSMDADNVARGVAYAKQLADKPGSELWVGSCDADVTPPSRARNTAEMVDSIKGGGGTNFCPVFELLEGTTPADRPDFVVIYTDGFGPAPALPPVGVQVLWVLSSSCGRPGTPAAWGTIIRLEYT